MKKNLKRKIIIHVKDLYEKFEIVNYLYNQYLIEIYLHQL